MKRSLLMAGLAPLVLAASLHAAADMFLMLDGIKGESSDDRHKDSIHIESFSWGASNPPASGGGAGKVSFSDLHCTASLSKASPKLMLACASGQHLSQATLYVCKTDGDRKDYYTIKLENVLVSSVQQSGRSSADANSTNSPPTEEVALYFDKVTVEHTADDGTVTTGTAVRTPVQ